MLIVALVAAGLALAAGGSTATAAPTVLTFGATADAATDASAPNRPFVDVSELPVDADPARASYLRFAIRGATTPVARAVLRLHVRDRSWAPSASGGSISRAGSGSWTEAALTWPTRPSVSAPAATLGAVARNTWVEVDVTSLVVGDGQLDLAITSTSTDGAAYDSREVAGLGPQLVVTLAEATTTTRTVTLAPTADLTVDASSPSAALGGGTQLSVGAAPDRATLLRFDLRGLSGRVVGASLRLHVRDDAAAASASGGRFALVSSTAWSEASTTWANRPAIDGSGLWTLGAVRRNGWVAMDVGWAVRTGTTLQVGATSTSADVATYDSRETASAPQLVVTIEEAAPTEPVTVLAAGDIARCDSPRDEATAALLAGSSAPILALGDLAYPGSGPTDLVDCFGPSWGAHKARIRPVVGNHEYRVGGAAPYWSYFGAAAGPTGKGWYSFDLGSWHVVALNSNCDEVGCGAGSEQLAWLQADLAATRAPCIAAMWHHPLFSSSSSKIDARLQPFWDALDAAGADLVLNGHVHAYERFAPQSSSGVAKASGIRQLIVGTGGMSLDALPPTSAPNSVARNATDHGVLKLSLGSGSWSWEFVPVAGGTYRDAGSATCR